MEILKLTEQERKAYSDWFSQCDVENRAKVSGVKASELFISSGLPTELLYQVCVFIKIPIERVST